MDCILLNIKEEEDDIDVETVELQFENNENNAEIFNHNLFEASSTCIPGSLSFVASCVRTNLVGTEENVSSLASCVRSNLVNTVEKVICKQAWKFSSFFLQYFFF